MVIEGSGLGALGLAVMVRDAGDGPLAYMMARSPELEYDHRDTDAQRRIVAGFLEPLTAWEVPAVGAAIEDRSTSGFYFNSIGQIHMPVWAKGHLALVGDAAHCASLLSGMGTSIAMIGAEILVTEWEAANGNLGVAGSAYLDRPKPHVGKAQASVKGGAFMMIPDTQEDPERRNAMLREFAVNAEARIYRATSASCRTPAGSGWCPETGATLGRPTDGECHMRN